ncbi:MAG: phage portal protein [Planctomycetaceae bacterium]|nr:phage portal protein [Phycisphaerales bacterium]MCE2653948.1 phage portal protein [Planctomycetaceae bacterium]
MSKPKRRPANAGEIKAKAEQAEALVRLERATLERRYLRLALGDYRSAKQSRLRQGGGAAGGEGRTASGAWHLDAQTARLLRRDAQRLARNNPLGRALIGRLVDFVLGRGHSPQATTASKGWNDQAERVWAEWAETAGLDEALELAYRGALVDGDCALLMLDDGGVQVVEADQITTPKSGGGTVITKVVVVKAGDKTGGEPGNVINAGVEMTPTGTVVAIHVAEWEGDGSKLSETTRRIVCGPDGPALLLRRRTRASQVRGEPLLAATVDTFEHLERFTEATVVAARMAACTGAAIKTEYPALTQASMLGATGEPNSRGQQQRALSWEPGMVWHLKPGESLEQVRPEQPTGEFSDFVRTLIRIAGTDSGLPLEVCLLDFSQANFHSSRSAMGVMYRFIEREQKRLQREVLAPLYRWVMRRAVAAGTLPGNVDMLRHRWMAPGRPVLDPQAEVAAAIQAVDANMRTKEDVVAEMSGADFATVAERRAAERKLEEQLGIQPPTTPGAGVLGGAAGGAAAPVPAAAAAESTPADGAAEPAAAVVAGADTVADTALNGAQVAALADLAMQVATGQLPLATARGIAEAAFPTVDPAVLDKVFGPLANFTPQTAAVAGGAA